MGSVVSGVQVAAPAPGRRRVRGPAAAHSWLRAHVTDEWAVALLAATLSIGFFVWYDAHGLTVAFNDARIRELIARRVIMSRTPGLAQLGSTWLPLPFMLMLPLIWNNALFSDGIAGSLPSMLAYVVAAVYLYRAARLVTSSRGAGWVAAGALMVNPSLLYIQGTPMSETASLSAFIVSVFYALKLIRTYHAADVVKCAFAGAAGTLIRYENWVLAVAVLPILVYVGWRRRGYIHAEAWVILYGVLAFSGCAGWVLYNAVIFHNPLLSFFYGQHSETFYANTPAYQLPARGHALTALNMYGLTVLGIAGPVITVMALAGFAMFVWRMRLRRTALPAYLLLVPFATYWLVLYLGINTESLNTPGLGTGPLYNVRFGLLMIPAVSFFAGMLAMAGPVLLRRIVASAALAVILASSVIVTTRSTALVLREARYGAQGAGTAVAGREDASWLWSHYRGGNILITYVNNPSMIFYLLTAHHVPDSALITDTNGSQFAGALAEPQRWVTWIVMNSYAKNGKSQIWEDLGGRTDWRRYFVLVRTSGTTQIYMRRTVITRPAAQKRSAGPQIVTSTQTPAS